MALKLDIRLGRILLFIILILIILLALFYVWWAYIFFPNDYERTREEALQPGPKSASQVIDISLIDRIDEAKMEGDFSEKRINKIVTDLHENNFFLKDDPYINKRRRKYIFRFGSGFPGIWMDERSSLIIPSHSKISFQAQMKDSPHLNFSALSPLSNGKLRVELFYDNGESIRHEFDMEVYEQRYSIRDIGIKFCNRKFDNATNDVGWVDLSINLSKTAYKNVNISFSYQSKDKDGVLFLANPRIFSPSVHRRYNVIYLVFDGVSTRHWSFYNNRSDLTPFMKEVADREFIVFDNMFALGNKTRISTSGLFCSVLPFITRHGINRNFIPEREKESFYKLVRRGKLATLPDIYRQRGYITHQYGNSGFTVHLITTGVDYGFDRSYEFSYNPYDSYGVSHALFKFLRENREKEFFLYLHYNSPHKPFFAPIKYYLKGIVNAPKECLWRPLFMGCINYTDDVFKNIYSALKSNDLLNNTILVVATDHGAGYDAIKYDKGFQYNDYTRMSFMIRLPDNLRKKLGITKRRIDTFLSAINTGPTLLDLCGMGKASAFMGRSYSELLHGEYNKRFFDKEIWCFGRKTVSLISDNMYKYILSAADAKRNIDWEYTFFGYGREMPFEEIYNLKYDPLESHNLIHSERSILRDFRNRYVKKDLHHPERRVLTFMPSDEKSRSIEVVIKSPSRVVKAGLYSTNLKKEDIPKEIYGRNSYSFYFAVKGKPVHFIFENEDDRSPLSIFIKANGEYIQGDSIFATYLNLNIFQNPIILKKSTDFLILNDTRLPGDSVIEDESRDLMVKISIIDLHRWIDIGRYENYGISAGMKETLRSWGYIQ
ncbi:MAG: sulfatase-like hydrolase/transferase [Spirochaetota bacterium]|nr:sulfatase-like hydrolase/transferase [Spirochaetota bacterium]